MKKFKILNDDHGHFPTFAQDCYNYYLIYNGCKRCEELATKRKSLEKIYKESDVS